MTNFSTDDSVREVIIDSKSETTETIKESEEWSHFAKGIIRIAIFLFETAVINMAFNGFIVPYFNIRELPIGAILLINLAFNIKVLGSRFISILLVTTILKLIYL